MRTYKRKLYRNIQKFKFLDKLLSDVACEIYNFALTYKKDLYKNEKKNISTNELQKILTKEKINHPKWNDLGSTAIQQIVERISLGYMLYFNNIKDRKEGLTKRVVKLPKLKRSDRYKSITLKKGNFRVFDEYIKVSDRCFKFYKHKKQPILGNIKTITVKRNRLGEYFVFIVTDYVEPTKVIKRSGKQIGFDFGLITFLIASSSQNDDIISPLFFKAERGNIQRLHRELSSKKPDSNNRRKIILRLNRTYESIANKRENYHWQLAIMLVKQYDVIFLENLDIDGIRRIHGRKINDLGFADFVSKLIYIADKYGKQIVKIDRWYPSSKVCNICEYYNKSLGKYDREWTCPNCQTLHNRDRNAASNIYRVGTSTLAGNYVRPSFNEKALVVDSRTPRL